jgi:hypothetical protein
MDKPLSRSGDAPLQRFLDRSEVLQATMDQLGKDLALAVDELHMPQDHTDAFERLRAEVLPVLQRMEAEGDRLRVAMYRVDIPEPHFRRTMASGGLHALAGEVVLRALQKVLTRLRYAGRY